MLSRIVVVFLIAMPLAGFASGQSAKSDPKSGEEGEVRIYDTSDLPPDADLGALARFMPVQVEPLTASLVVVLARPEAHDQFRAALTQLRGLAPPRITLGAVLHRVADVSGVEVGAPAGAEVMGAPVIRRVQMAGTRRASLSVRSLETVGYVRDLTPVVGASVAAFDVEVGSAASGLELRVIVGDAAAGSSPVSVTGGFSVSNAARRNAPEVTAAGVAPGSSDVDVLSTVERALNATLLVPDDRPIVAAVIDDPGSPGASLVLTITVSPAD